MSLQSLSILALLSLLSPLSPFSLLSLLTLFLPGFQDYVKGQGGGRICPIHCEPPKPMRNPFFLYFWNHWANLGIFTKPFWKIYCIFRQNSTFFLMFCRAYLPLPLAGIGLSLIMQLNKYTLSCILGLFNQFSLVSLFNLGSLFILFNHYSQWLELE